MFDNNENTDHLSTPSSRSEDANVFISHKPSYIERNGIQIIVFIFFVLLISTWFIKYPDRVTQVGYLSAENAPKEIKPKMEGVLSKLLFANGTMVKKGDIIGWLESDTDYRNVLSLLGDLDNLESKVKNGNKKIEKDKFIIKISQFNSGEIQQAYSEFISGLIKYEDLHINGFYRHKISVIASGITAVNRKNGILKNQSELSKKDLSLTEELYNIDRALEKSNLVTKENLKHSESQLINKEKSREDIILAIINNEASINEKRGEIATLEHDIALSQVNFSQSIQALKAAIVSWIERYSIKANADGKIEFSSFIQENQLLSVNKPIGYVIPLKSKYFLKSTLSQHVLGKLEKNTPVEIRFAAYPYKDFGVLNGSLSQISDVAVDSGFLSKIDLPKGLQTNLSQNIPYRENLKAEAIFITKDLRLLERLFNSLTRTSQ